MSVFAAAIDDLFADPNIAQAATYHAGGMGAGMAVTVLRRAADATADIFGAEIVAPATTLEVRASEVTSPAEGDTFTIGAEVLVVKGTPVRDEDRLVWKIDTRPQ